MDIVIKHSIISSVHTRDQESLAKCGGKCLTVHVEAKSKITNGYTTTCRLSKRRELGALYRHHASTSYMDSSKSARNYHSLAWVLEMIILLNSSVSQSMALERSSLRCVNNTTPTGATACMAVLAASASAKAICSTPAPCGPLQCDIQPTCQTDNWQRPADINCSSEVSTTNLGCMDVDVHQVIQGTHIAAWCTGLCQVFECPFHMLDFLQHDVS